VKDFRRRRKVASVGFTGAATVDAMVMAASAEFATSGKWDPVVDPGPQDHK
jgi:hypothetical protein